MKGFLLKIDKRDRKKKYAFPSNFNYKLNIYIYYDLQRKRKLRSNILFDGSIYSSNP